MQVSAKRKDDKEATSVDYDFGTSITDATAKFGADVIFAKFKQSAIIDLQSFIRRALDKADKDKKPLAPGELQKAVAAWKPDNKVVVRKSAAEKAKDAVAGLSKEERADLLKQLMAKQ